MISSTKQLTVEALNKVFAEMARNDRSISIWVQELGIDPNNSQMFTIDEANSTVHMRANYAPLGDRYKSERDYYLSALNFELFRLFGVEVAKFVPKRIAHFFGGEEAPKIPIKYPCPQHFFTYYILNMLTVHLREEGYEISTPKKPAGYILNPQALNFPSHLMHGSHQNKGDGKITVDKTQLDGFDGAAFLKKASEGRPGI
ncbi:MAG: hypothetical protein AB7U41_03440 [Dongiaceae bacterium]